MAKEYIERNEFIENLNRFAPEHYNALINLLITKQPTADVVEVVRCKDCKCFMEYSEEYEGNVEGADGDCYLRYMNSCNVSEQFCAVRHDDFCSCGKRKEGE